MSNIRSVCLSDLPWERRTASSRSARLAEADWDRNNPQRAAMGWHYASHELLESGERANFATSLKLRTKFARAGP
jgi:hypothetical protein